MPSYLDLGLIAVVLVSALLSMVRGFTREVLAIASWGAAALAALYFHPLVTPFLKGQPYMDKPQVAQGVAAAIVFFVTLIVVSIVTVKISDVILDSKVGALDRSLGFLFGAARGFLLCVVAFLFFDWLVQGKEPEWARNARTRPFLVAAGEQIKSLLPDDPESALKGLRKPKGGSDEGPAEDDPKAAPAPAPAPQKRTDAPAQPAGQRPNAAQPTAGVAQNDRKNLENLLQQGGTAQKTAPTR